jgi:hypothetical protein
MCLEMDHSRHIKANLNRILSGIVCVLLLFAMKAFGGGVTSGKESLISIGMGLCGLHTWAGCGLADKESLTSAGNSSPGLQSAVTNFCKSYF